MTSDTPETDAQLTTFESISKLKKRFVNKTGTVGVDFTRNMERERDEALNLLREARDKCYRLRRDRLAITRSYLDVSEMLDRAVDGLKEIAKMDASQDASPQQCGAVLISMNTLQELQ
jgi:hypothetical protein